MKAWPKCTFMDRRGILISGEIAHQSSTHTTIRHACPPYKMPTPYGIREFGHTYSDIPNKYISTKPVIIMKHPDKKQWVKELQHLMACHAILPKSYFLSTANHLYDPKLTPSQVFEKWKDVK